MAGLTDFFLKIKGIEGESNDSKHKNEIDVESWSWGETQSGSHAQGSGGGAGKVSMQDFHFTAKISKASAKLFLACAGGDHIDEAVLTCRKAGKDQQEYLKITMSGLLVSSYQTGGSGHSDIVPVDQVSLNFSKLQLDYKPQDSKGGLGGPVKAGWDLTANKSM
ncbi:MAG TPA: type VI secretion system tube protein Hcp [Pirellulales bacterium]|jgi:type VI secretion system secreted protein Hcp|nr:type VI secretion system tube protein Hcp [Pirellulales bacterium]